MAEQLIEVRFAAYLARGFDEWFEGTGVMQGDEDNDPEMLALKTAWLSRKRVPYGSGYRVVLTADRHTLDILKEYTGYCLNANSDESNPREVRGATGLARAIELACAQVGAPS